MMHVIITAMNHDRHNLPYDDTDNISHDLFMQSLEEQELMLTAIMIITNNGFCTAYYSLVVMVIIVSECIEYSGIVVVVTINNDNANHAHIDIYNTDGYKDILVMIIESQINQF